MFHGNVCRHSPYHTSVRITFNTKGRTHSQRQSMSHSCHNQRRTNSPPLLNDHTTLYLGFTPFSQSDTAHSTHFIQTWYFTLHLMQGVVTPVDSVVSFLECNCSIDFLYTDAKNPCAVDKPTFADVLSEAAWSHTYMPLHTVYVQASSTV